MAGIRPALGLIIAKLKTINFMVLFLFTFSLLYGAIHVYAFVRADRVFHFPAGIKTIILLLLIILIFAPLLVRITEKNHLENLARLFAYAGYLWMAFLFLFFLLSVIFDTTRLGLQYFFPRLTVWPLANIAFGLAVFLSLILVVYGYFDAQIIRIKRLAVTTGHKLPGSGRLRVVQISDVHVGIIIKEKRLQTLADKISQTQPDIVVSTGDLLDGELNNVLPLAAVLEKIKPPFGKYAVAGNHEYYAGINKSLEFTRKAGFTVLRDQAIEVAGINIVGIDDIASRKATLGKENARSTRTKPVIDNNKFVLLLKHQPSVNINDKFNLQLSGHTHGGQVFPFRLITSLFFKNHYGYYELGENKFLYVSRGAGTWGPPVRIFAPPEITVVDLIGQKAP